jgi:hypothetical protein
MVFETSVEGWSPFDGDSFVTKEGFIFNVFGYEHPDGHSFRLFKVYSIDIKKSVYCSIFRMILESWRFETFPR